MRTPKKGVRLKENHLHTNKKHYVFKKTKSIHRPNENPITPPKFALTDPRTFYDQ